MFIECRKTCAMIRSIQSQDIDAITAIYNHYISDTIVTFEIDCITPSVMRQRVKEAREQGYPWLVAEDGSGKVVGYAYAGKWKGRLAYRHSAEISVYLDQQATGQGLGTALYEQLFSELAKRKIHVAIGGISLPNPASIALHEKLGMTKVAHFSEVGFKFEKWIDVGYWQKVIE